jgi:membrane protein YqaA with SNARE-associated domain
MEAARMHAIISHLFVVFVRLGGFGLLLLGVLDDSFLFMPLGNDLLMVALTARNHRMLPVYAAMASAGSVIGCLIIDWVSRKGGKAGLDRILKGRELKYVKRKVENNAGWTLAFASILPPPFPFTAFVIGAAAFQYPRKRLLTIIGAARLVRFFALGWLAILYGRSVLRLARSSAVETAILILVAISIVGSALSIVSWIQRSRQGRS